MRDFFISTFEKIVGIIVILMGIAVILGAFGAGAQNGILAFLGVLVFGAVYVVLMGGLMYLGLGIYHNTKRMADAMDKSGPSG